MGQGHSFFWREAGVMATGDIPQLPVRESLTEPVSNFPLLARSHEWPNGCRWRSRTCLDFRFPAAYTSPQCDQKKDPGRDLFHRLPEARVICCWQIRALGGGCHDLDFGQQMDRGSLDARYPAYSGMGIHPGLGPHWRPPVEPQLERIAGPRVFPPPGAFSAPSNLQWASWSTYIFVGSCNGSL